KVPARDRSDRYDRDAQGGLALSLPCHPLVPSVRRRDPWPLPADARPDRLNQARRSYVIRSFVCVHTVMRWTPNRREIDTTLSPLIRAVRIESTSLSVNGVLVRLLGVVTTPGSPSGASTASSPIPRFACFQAESRRSNLCQVFGLSPPASPHFSACLAEFTPFVGRPRAPESTRGVGSQLCPLENRIVDSKRPRVVPVRPRGGR